MDEQLTTNWPRALDAIARRLNPLHQKIFKLSPMDYYWSGYQTEWATDVLFKDPRSLAGLFPLLVRHAIHHFKSPDVMRFLAPKSHGNFTGEIITSFKHRAEGVRVKHWIRGNSIKMYDKAGCVLRVEMTIKLLEEGATVPFIARYRKEATGNLDEVKLYDIDERAETSSTSILR